MGQGFERFPNRKPNYSSRNTFFSKGPKQPKLEISNFFSFGKKLHNLPIQSHHISKTYHHIHRHHKKYIFGGAIGFLFIKLLITLFTSISGLTQAQDSMEQYIIGDGIISQYEQCDDGNDLDGDGCDSTGQIEPGAICIGEPSICSVSPTDIQADNFPILPEVTSPQDFILPKQIASSPIDSTPPITLSDMGNIDILNHFYGPDSQFTQSRSNKQCSLSNLNVVRLNPGYNTIPNFLSPNTLYLLNPGYYDNSYMINIDSDCSALIGLDSTVHLHTTLQRGANIRIGLGQNIILQNLVLDGSQSSTGIIHGANNYSIFLATPNNYISHITGYDTIGFSVYMENFQNHISNISRYTSSSSIISDAVNIPIILPLQFTGNDISQLFLENGYSLSGDIWQGIRPFNLISNSIFPVDLNIYSIDYQIQLSISSGTRLANLDGSAFTSILLSPKTISIPQIQNYFSGQNILSAFKISSDQNFIQSTDTIANPKDFGVSILIPYPISTNEIFLYHSYDGQTWSSISGFQIKQTQSGSNISFMFNQFGNFAIIKLDTFTASSPSQPAIDDSLQDLIDGLIQIGVPVEGLTPIATGDTIQTGIVDYTGSTSIKTPSSDKKISDGIQTPKQEQIQTMEKKDKKDKLRGKGYYENGAGKMIGNQPIDIGDLESEITSSIVMQSTGYDIIEVELSEGTFVYTDAGILYTGVLDIPRFVDQEDINIPNFQTFKVIQIPPDHPDLFFKDIDNNPAYVTIRIPTPDIPTGELVVVNYSNDQTNRHYLTDTTITSIDDNNFAVFQTNHFTTFSIGVYSGAFTINNDDASTTSTGVTLNMNVSGVTHMKFGNTKYDRDNSPWIPYSSTYPRILDTKAGLQTVYAVFSGQGEIVFVQDDIIGSRDWNNDYFIDDYFRSTNPSSGDIKTALYGDGIGSSDKTAYTKYRSGVLCNPSTMNLIYVDPGINTIPNTLIANTIYVLNGGDYIKTATITAGGNCIAIIGKDRARLFQSNSFSNGAIYATSRSNIIIDKIEIDGVSNGTGGTHYSTIYGIYLRNVGNGHTVNNVSISNTRSYGIYLNTSINNFFNNIKVYNTNTDGIYTTATAGNNIIQNSQFFNNARYGININSPSNKINNVQSYNNLYAGIIINGSASTNNVVNNLQTYNNAIYGIYLMSTSGTILNNISSYSNNLYGLYFNNTTSHTKVNNIALFNNSKGYYTNNNVGQVENYYYGDIKVFGNNDDYFGDKIAMGGSEYSDIGRTTGSIYNTGEYGCDFVSKPDGLLYHPNDESCNFRGVDGSLSIDYLTHSYIYGLGLANQSKTITYSGDGLIFDNLNYNPDHKIGQINSVNNIGYIKFKNNTYFTDMTGVQLYFGYDQIGSEYIITGDFLGSPITGLTTSYNSKIDIILTSNIGRKNAYITFISGSQSRLFKSSIEYIGTISDPIVEKYFGYNSFYTDNREYGFCDPRNITIITLDPGTNTIPTPVVNRIYLLNSGNYISTGVKALLECNVLVGSGDVFHFTDVTRSNATITANDRNIIVDNIKFDGKNDGIGGVHNANSSSIYSTISSNITINDVDIYNHSIGAYTLYHKNVLINNVNSYNNYQGTSLSYGLRLHATANAMLNNIKSFNNYSENIHVNNLSSNISLNNIISFNSRRQGISVYNPSNLVLNNALLLNNNSNGIFSTSLQNPIINQVSSYNNVGGGITLNGSIKYYGSNNLYQNSNDTIDGIAGGLEFGYLGRSSGTLDSQGSINCTKIVNPQNIDSSYLQTGELCDFRTYNPSISGYTTDYSYGVNIPTQTQPVYFKNQDIIPSQILYYTGNYIAGPPIPIVTNYILSYSAGPNGNISGDSLQTIQEGNHGSPVLAIADTGYYFVKRSDESTNNPRIDNYVIGNISVIAEFAMIAPTEFHSGLVAYIPFDDDANDYSIYFHGSSGFSTNSTTGKINNAYNFDGSTSYVDITNSDQLNPTDQITLAAWLKRNIDPALGSNRASIINKNVDNQYRLQHDRNNTLFEFALRAPNSVWVTSTTVPVSGERYFLVGTYDGQELKLYVNGILEKTGSNIGSIETSTTSVNIGRRTIGDRHFNGDIDEVAIWSRALSSSEVLGLYNNGSGLSLMTTNNEYILSYSAGPNGSISGNSLQIIQEGNHGSPVLAIADTGYYFVKRSDESTNNPRTDLNVTENISVFAQFEQEDGQLSSIIDITLDPSLNISRFAPYTLIVQTSGTMISGSLNLGVLDGDNNSCRNYYTDGTCDSLAMTFPLLSSGNNIRVKTGIYPDYIYPEIFFAPSDITRNNTPIETTINRNNYHIFKMSNPFAMVDEMSFWIKFNAVPNNLNSSSDLYVYIASSDQELSNFGTDWRNSPNVELVGTLNKNNVFHHTHTTNSSHHLVALSTNSDGTIGNKNINISGQFWIILYQDSSNINRGWKLRYHDQSICTNTGSWYVSSAFSTPISQSGCPDAHVHIARRNANQDLVLADITMYYQDGENISQITGNNTFSFGEIPNMSPNQTSFINPLGLGVYNTAIDILWNPASDPNNDVLLYNLYLLSHTGVRLSTISTGISTTGYLRDISMMLDGEYGLELESCDPGLLCSQSYLDDNFFLDKTPATIIFTGATPPDQSILASNNFNTQIQIQDNLGLNSFVYIYDGTTYNIYDSGLLLMYNFDNISSLGETTTIVRDYSHHFNTGAIHGNPQHISSGVWNSAYSFDGFNDQYISIGDGAGLDLGTSHTISIRINPSLRSGSVLGQMSGVSAIYISGSQIGYSTSPGDYVFFDVNLSTGQRTHLAISRSSTNISLYKNGLFVSSDILGDNTPLELFYIGKESNIGSNEKRFSGSIDDLFIYNRPLAPGEISQIYRSNLSVVSDNKFIYTSDYSCTITGGIYSYSGIVSDRASNISYVNRTNTISLPNPLSDISATSISLGQIQSSYQVQSISGQSQDYFKITDRKGSDTWYTTISLPSQLQNNLNPSFNISGSNIYFKSDAINTISGTSTDNIYVVGDFSDYVNLLGVTAYIRRDQSDIPFMCKGGIYGDKPWIKVDVPGGQSIGSYTGTITYDIIY